MNILHVATECYPAAKSGGLGDVVGALPKYQNLAGKMAVVVIPKYRMEWFVEHHFETIFASTVRLGSVYVPFSIQELIDDYLGFKLLVADIPGLFDRDGIYNDRFTGFPYHDEVERYLVFQQAVLKFIIQLEIRPDILHCHDHHTGLIPFMVKHCPDYRVLHFMPTVYTIHNGNYQGAFGWDKLPLLPFFEEQARGLLDWNHHINPMACAVKCAWQVTTVSPGYLQELQISSLGLESLFQQEAAKCTGIINGIDTKLWNPAEDAWIAAQFQGDIGAFKAQNKAKLLEMFRLHESLPLYVYIGRFAREKGADLLPDSIASYLNQGGRGVFLILGSGDSALAAKFEALKNHYEGFFNCAIVFNEQLAHQFYAGADFLMMPSRTEPCGLNQFYAYRYGTIPIVRNTGGLSDTVIDLSHHNGTGIKFEHFTVEELLIAFYRSNQLFQEQDNLFAIRNRIMQLDYSWQKSEEVYQMVYDRMLKPS